MTTLLVEYLAKEKVRRTTCPDDNSLCHVTVTEFEISSSDRVLFAFAINCSKVYHGEKFTTKDKLGYQTDSSEVTSSDLLSVYVSLVITNVLVSDLVSNSISDADQNCLDHSLPFNANFCRYEESEVLHVKLV